MKQTPQQLPSQFGDEESRRLRLAFLDFDARDVALLRDLQDLIRDHVTDIVDQFYRHLTAFEHTRRIFVDEAMIGRQC